LEGQLRAAFKLRNLDEVRRAVNNYRRQCQRLVAVAESAAKLRAEVLQQALTWYAASPKRHASVVRQLGSIEKKRRDLIIAVERLVESGEIAKAARTIEAFSDGRSDTPFWQRHVGFIAASRLAGSGNLKAALKLAASVRYAPWRRTTYRVLAAYAVTQGRHAAVWDYAHAEGVSDGDRIALLSGLIAGARNAPRNVSAPKTAEGA
jgi:hypothetical protein